MKSNIDPSQGGGPWSIDLPALPAGEGREMHLNRFEYRGRKGYFRPWLPLDSVTVKNRDPENVVQLTVNGLYSVLIEPNAVETYAEAGITSLRVENVGTTEIPDGRLLLQVAADAYDADDAALEQAKRPAVEKVVRGFLGL